VYRLHARQGKLEGRPEHCRHLRHPVRHRRVQSRRVQRQVRNGAVRRHLRSALLENTAASPLGQVSARRARHACIEGAGSKASAVEPAARAGTFLAGSGPP
jgi:hypothetical protein